MAKILIYTTDYCHYCKRAKALLDGKGAQYQEIDLSNDQEERERLIIKANGRKTVPQIFIGDYHVGGCDDLIALDKSGKLDELLK